MGEVQQTDGVERASGLGCNILVEGHRPRHMPARRAQPQQAKRNVVFDRVTGKKGDDLICSRQFAVSTFVWPQRRDILAKELDTSRVRMQIAADLVEQCRFAGSVWADDQPSFAWPYGEGNVIGHYKAAKCLLQLDDLKCTAVSGRAHRASPRSAADSLLKPGTIPVGITSTINRNTRPSSMFHRSI